MSRAGQETMREAVAGMGQIKARVDVIEENILALSERTNQIGEIIDTVNDIIRQFLRPPIFEDQERSRIAGLLCPISLSLSAVLVVTAVSSVLLGHFESQYMSRLFQEEYPELYEDEG